MDIRVWLLIAIVGLIFAAWVHGCWYPDDEDL